MALIRQRPKPLAEMSDRQLRKRMADAQRALDALPDRPPLGQIESLLAQADKAAAYGRAARDELARRARREEDARMAPLRRGQLLGKRSGTLKALDVVAQCGDSELQGETLVADRLTDDEAQELVLLARRRRNGDTLSDADVAAFEQLAGRAAGDEGLYARKRAEREEKAKLAALRRAERAHPQSSSLVAAILSDPDLLDGLQHRLRDDVVVLDELGRKQQGATACRIYEYENIAALHVLVSLIVANGGQPIIVYEHGYLPGGLPPLPQGALGQLRRNQWLTTEQTGTGTLVGLGERVRGIADHWSIELPPADADD